MWRETGMQLDAVDHADHVGMIETATFPSGQETVEVVIGLSVPATNGPVT